MLQKIQRFGGAMFAPAMLFLYQPHGRVSALATTADIVAISPYTEPLVRFLGYHPARLVDGL